MANKRKLFVNPGMMNPMKPVGVRPNRNSGPSLAGRVIEGVSVAKSVYDNLPPAVKGGIRDTVSNAYGNLNANAGTPASDSHSSGYSLSPKPNPRMTKMDTGIKPNTYTTSDLTAKEDVCSPLHMSHALIQIPTTAASDLFTFFKNTVALDLQSNAQSNLSFNINLTDFSTTNILSTFNSVLYALQIYYYYSSILTYQSVPGQNNAGMLYLRSQITAQMIEDLNMLKRRLADIAFPPNMFELVRFINTNYYSGPTQGAPLIKVFPISSTSTLVLGSDIVTAYNGITADTPSLVLNILGKAVPHWKMDLMEDVPLEPVYNSNFSTIFANLPFTYHNGTTVIQVPSVANADATIAYNSYTNSLDGLAFALTSVYDTSATSWNPGLITINSGSTAITGNTRRSYYKVSGTEGFYIVKSYSFLIRSRQESYTFNDTGLSTVSCHLTGADKCLNVNANSITETGKAALDYLMSWDTIAINPLPQFGQSNKFVPKVRKDNTRTRK